VATLALTRRLDLTDEQWARLEPLLPVPTRSGRPSEWTKRQLIDGIRWQVRVGAPWRDVPDCYGSWRAVYALFRRWQRAGARAQIVTALQTRADAAGLITWDVSVDSTIARAHQHTAGARRHPGQQQEPPGGLSAEPDDHALGRSRGGLTTKIHLACEQGQKVLSLVVTAGQRGDSPQFQAVLDGINVPRTGAGRPAHGPARSGQTRPTAPAPTALTCADAASPAPFPNQQTNNNTARTAAAEAAALPGSARTTTEPGTPPNAESTDSNATAPSPPDTTNSPSDTKPSSTSPSSTTGS